MQHQWKWKDAKAKSLVLVAAAVLAGCGGTEMPVSESSAPLLGGVATNARPEIGVISGGCTATLIAPQWVLSAGHCVGYSNMVAPGFIFRVTRGLDGLEHEGAGWSRPSPAPPSPTA